MFKFDTPATTGIGSVPHHNIDAALEFSFQTSIPYLPQIPLRNPWEYMVPQVLEGLPGLQVEKEGLAVLDASVWSGRYRAFEDQLDKAFSRSTGYDAFFPFEPSPACYSCYQPFLWELEERKIKTAKVQVCGPLTAQWAIRLKDNNPIDKYPELENQIYRLVLARSIAMVRRLTGIGVYPILFLDEPALYGLNPDNPRHIVGLSQLRVMIQTLKKEGAAIGLHCCSHTDWKRILELPLDILSLDTNLCLSAVLSEKEKTQAFMERGGRFALGLVPTSRDPHSVEHLEPGLLLERLITILHSYLNDKATKQLLRQSILTPACGLVFQTPRLAELILAALLKIADVMRQRLSSAAK